MRSRCTSRPAQRCSYSARARGAARDASDLDLAIDAGRPLSLDDRGRLAQSFEESDLPYRVGIVDLVTVDVAFRQQSRACDPARPRSSQSAQR